MLHPLLAFVSPGPIQMLIVLGIVLLLFGNRLPGAMRNVGRSINEFKKGTREGGEDEDLDEADRVTDKSKSKDE